ncbi:MAG: dihydroorotase [Nitrospirae bacterium]|nr:dihydroorotase [Nitrospirota bacterium]
MDNSILIKNGHIIDPSQGIDGIGDVLIEDGKIKKVGSRQSTVYSQNKDKNLKSQISNLKVIDATGLYVLPGLVDMHAHLREPGFEYKETIKTGTMAAVRGGFTTMCCMPNTNPVNDNAAVTGFIIKKALEKGACSVYPIGAITKGQKGEELSEMGELIDSGCVAFSDDGQPVMNNLIMRRALEYSRIFGVPVISHCEDLTLSNGGVMNEGTVSIILGLKGIPRAAEDIMVARDIALAELTGGRLHIAHVSTKGAVRLIREAKHRGVKITAETCPHYFTLTEEAVIGYNTNTKVKPPLRTSEDIAAIKEGLSDGTIDVIATDHAPHHIDDKFREFDTAPFGISGLETALSLSLKLVEEGILDLKQFIMKISLNPSKIIGIKSGTLREGADADIVIVDINREFTVDPEKFASMGKNTPFEGWVLKGMAVMTICKGKINEIDID